MQHFYSSRGIGNTNPWAVVDGSLTAPIGGSFIQSNFFTYARQSGQSAYSTRPPWKVAGVDYAIGIPSTSLPLLDPLPSGVIASGLAIQGFSVATNGPETYITTSASNPVVDGYDFSLHNGVRCDFSPSATGVATVQNCNFKIGSNNVNTPGYCISARGSVALIIQNCLIDGNGINFPSNLATGPIWSQATGAVVLQYNAVLRASQSSLELDPTNNNFTIQFCYFEGINCNNQGHATIPSVQWVGTIPVYTYKFNVGLLSSSMPGGVTAMHELDSASAVGPTKITTVNITNNTLIANNPSAAAVFAVQRHTYNTMSYLQNYMDSTGCTNGYFEKLVTPTIGSLVGLGNIELRTGANVDSSFV